MTSTTAAAAALVDGEHLVHRPRGVVHLYRGALTASGRYAKAGPACGQRTNRLQVLEPPAGGPLDPAWTRRLCTRCEPLLAAAPAPTTRDGWAVYGDLTVRNLAVDLLMAETAEEVNRVLFLALRVVGFRDAAAPLPGRDSSDSLLTRISRRRALVDVEFRERQDAHRARDRERAERSRIGRAKDVASEARQLANHTGNAVDRLRATRAEERAARLAGRVPTESRKPAVVKGGPSCSRSA